MVVEDNLLLSGGEDCFLRLWDWEQGTSMKAVPGHANAIWSGCTDQAAIIATGSWDRVVKPWNFKKRGKKPKYQTELEKKFGVSVGKGIEIDNQS